MNNILNARGAKITSNIHLNLTPDDLIKRTTETGRGELANNGALIVKTGKHTGRSAKDKYIVKNEITKNSIWWENSLTEMNEDHFNKLKNDVTNYLNEQKDLFATHRSVGASTENNLGVVTLSTEPQHALFTTYLFREPHGEINENKDFLILHAPNMLINKEDYGLHNPTVITTCFKQNITIIVGSLYAGEIKKSMFCVFNYLMPERGILPMHAGASVDKHENVSVFFGLSGTGKTTLSTDTGMLLIGDDEHGMSDEGVFNFEGGCYAKTLNLSKEGEPEIYEASTKHGSLLENVVMNDQGVIDFDDDTLAENGRSSYPLSFISERVENSKGGVPNNIFFLTADAFGVLPPISKLTKEQAMFYFVLGYTSKLAGTEIGVVEPEATFSACFGAPFMMRHPEEYAKLLGEYLDRHDINVWLVNTGWTGGPYGEGKRFPLKITREIIRSIQKGDNLKSEFKPDEIFGLMIPETLGSVDTNVLKPQSTWKDPSKYNELATNLAKNFHKQMNKFGEFYNKNIDGAPLVK